MKRIPELTAEQQARFWSNVAKGKPDVCWEWTGSRREHGYGCIHFGRSRYYAHRLAWTLANGPIPPGMCILHRCDHPPCVNPAHLRLGTQLDNIADRQQKGRQAQGETWGQRKPDWKPARGEAHWCAVLTEAQVKQIWEWRKDFTLQEISYRSGVSVSQIHRILHGQSWAVVTEKLEAAPNATHHVRGQANWRSRLTEAQVREIWRLGKLRGFICRDIATLTGTTPSQVGQVLRRETWVWLTDQLE